MEENFKMLINAISALDPPDYLDYMQLAASIISIIISAVAVIMAVRVPRKIADRQDKITLFDKRFASYEVFMIYEAFAWQIEKIEGVNNYKRKFLNTFYFGENVEFQGIEALIKLRHTSINLQHLSFLFENITEKELAQIFESMCDFIIAMEKNVNVEECKKQFINLVKTFREKHHEHIMNALKTGC